MTAMDKKPCWERTVKWRGGRSQLQIRAARELWYDNTKAGTRIYHYLSMQRAELDGIRMYSLIILGFAVTYARI